VNLTGKPHYQRNAGLAACKLRPGVGTAKSIVKNSRTGMDVVKEQK
jgi:hypothetical protein